MGEKRAYIWGAPMDISKRASIKGEIANWMTNIFFLSAYKLSEESMHEYAIKLRRFKPKLLIGYSSVLALFAEFLQANNITDVSPEAIISSAEVLYPYQRKLIESVFNCKVFNRYGSREVAHIACECDRHNGMHINAERVYIEFLKDDKPVEPGESGEILVTSLDNYGMPFIRYAIGDIGIPSDRICKCGRGLPLMENVEGRSFDIIIGTNGNRLGGTFWTILLRRTVQGIKQFQVIQNSKSRLDIKIVKDGSLFNSSCIPKLVEKIKEYCGSDMRVEFHVVNSITPTKSGKHRFVISEIASGIAVHSEVCNVHSESCQIVDEL
jgi:phenylacetate-CoA ligase